MPTSIFFRVSLLLLLWFSISLAYPSDVNIAYFQRREVKSAEPLPPSQDAFYTAPPSYEHTLPGTILRVRNTPGNLTSITGNCSASYNILYCTIDSNFRPAWAVTTLFIPRTFNTTNNPSLLSYQIPYNTASIDGSASYVLYGGEYPDIGVALGRGWAVSVPDFEGPSAAFALGLSEGRAVLDSIRAVQSTISSPLTTQFEQRWARNVTVRTALWGYSGGSIASLWALELHAGYAPDLILHGAAIGGLVVNATDALYKVSGTAFSGLLPAALLGITAQDPAARAELLTQLTPANASTFLSALNMTYAQVAAAFAYQNVAADYFIGGLGPLLAQPAIKHIVDNNAYSGYHGIPQVPLFVYKAIGDTLAPISDTDYVVEKVYCRLGVDVRYERNTVGGHLAEYTNGVGSARQFLAWVFDGIDEGEVVSVGGGCTVANVTVGSDTSPL
jgi:hypothetical protein